MEGGKLNEAIKALSKEISKEKAVPHRILQQLLNRHRTDSRYNEKREDGLCFLPIAPLHMN
jgi:HEPN domain-containing protein